MKKIIALFAVFITYTSYGQSINDVVKLAFSSTTPRSGFTEEIIVLSDSVSVISYSKRTPDAKNIKTLAVQTADWKNLLKSIENIDIKNIENFESPTNKRATDGARHSEIVITTKDGKAYKHLFDDENPNEKLTGLLLSLKKMTNEK